MTEPTEPASLVQRAKSMGVELDAEAAASLLAYLDAMLQLNEHINLTAVRDREQAVVLHALDGVAFGLCGLRPHHVLDLGTGNGFPGVAVSVLFPHATVVLLDRTGKKVRAVGSCLVAAKLAGIETVQLDAAQAPALHPEMRHAFDLVTARAVGKPEVIAELAAPLVRPRGHLALWLDADAAAPAKLGSFRRERLLGYDLPEPAPRRRQIALYERGR